MGRIRKPRLAGEDFVSISAAMGDESPSQMIERLRAAAAARNSEPVDPFVADAQAEADARRQIVDRRTARLMAAGGVDPEAVEAAAASLGRCPRVDGHRGSERAAEAAKEFLAARTARTLILCGPPGRGKSFCATWLIAEFQYSSQWIAASEVRVGEQWPALRTKAEFVKLLVVDDLGREATDWAGRELADLIELRHNRGLRTAATTNLTRDQLISRYGDRLASRLNDTRMSMIVDVLGADMRKR